MASFLQTFFRGALPIILSAWQVCAVTAWAPLDAAGTQSLRAGRFADALEEVLVDTTFSDTALRYFKLGCAHAGLKNYGKAVFYFKQSARTDSLWAPFAYEKIGDVEQEGGRFENALQAYRAALDGAMTQRYQHHLYSEMYRIVTEHLGEIGDLEWLEEIMEEPPAGIEVSLTDQLERLIGEQAWRQIDSLVENLLDTSQYHQTHCDVASRLIQEPVPDSVLSTRALFRLSKIAFLCQAYPASSDWLLEALSRRDFDDVIHPRTYLYHRASLNFRLGNYNKCIRWFRRYEKKYGPTPGMVYMLARSYRSLGKAALATEWYDRHIKLYPRHAKTHDILWYRAWQKEEAGDNEAARERYRTIYQNHPGRSRADDAFFRCGLSYVKDGKHAAALASFRSFTKKYRSSQMLVGARYWKAKCHMLLSETDSALAGFREISRDHPTDYYAYRSREMLKVLNDSLAQFVMDTVYDEIAAAAWLDSTARSIRQALKPQDSISLTIGRVLSSLGMTDHAEYFLEPLEICYPANLYLQFQLARLYQESGNPTRSFSISRRFKWRIPVDSRGGIPLALYALMYPSGFAENIRRSAAEFNVTPQLLYAIIRQESIFDPVIVSPAGAVGLMQIMPFTGEEIAAALKDTFTVDLLYDPAINVRYGAYYISKLLKDFDGNMVLAVAGYNGGPHNAKKWFRHNKDDGFDMFVEDIGFTETRRYVKKVLANYWTYEKLAEAVASVED
ncbi:MAG: transglycosylase SLT domain-containing protein [Chitinivibrionales bacterium]|nr:transglycosylase SLT domain-containing protein [Chitinivibrionales bacterium]MBD3394056.1 transglycosylase SLT domain-containing protein [Chitinivibrionales bacterium]